MTPPFVLLVPEGPALVPEEMIPAFVFLLTGKSLSLHARKTRVTDQLLITGI
jgi:hypothetical protein